MAIKPLNKITLYGPEDDKTRVLKELQTLGCMHLIPLSEPTSGDSRAFMQPAQAKEALAWLERCPRQRRQVHDKQSQCIDTIVDKVLANKGAARAKSDERDKLEERIREVRPWGEFSLPDLSDLSDQRLWFYVIPNGEMNTLSAVELPWDIIHQDHKRSYVIVIAEQEPEEGLLPVPRSRIGKKSLSALEQQLEEAEHALEDLHAERESLSRWRYLLGQSLAARHDQAELYHAGHTAQDEDQFFLVQGWVPVSDQQAVEAFAANNGIAAIIQPPEDEDTPPTQLDNPQSTGGGADALSFFQLPSYRAWDPGNAVFYSFSLFFAMIMSDALYCGVFALILFSLRGKTRSTETGKRLLNMALFMSGLGIVWGVLVGSYFGVAPAQGSFLASVAVFDLHHYDSMMKLSISIGVAHLLVANLATFWVNRSRLYALAPAGWTLLISGGLAFWLSYMGDLPRSWQQHLAPAMMIIGAALVFLFTSTRPIRKFTDVILRIFDGLLALFNVTGAFGDVLSYMRLFALGLSGASLAMTFNNLAAEAMHTTPVFGVLSAGLILLLGHVLNFSLCLMSGVVHGMRLNVIEFCNWGLSEEGYPFKTFSKKED